MAPRPTPRYQEIATWLREQCAALPPGSALPAENDLAARFSVSRMTARHAVDVIVDEGLARRRSGAGTFVEAPALHRPNSVLRPFSQDMRSRGLVPSSQVLRAEMSRRPASAAELGLPPDAWLVLIERVRLASGTPIAIERTALPQEFQGVLEADLEKGSLHEALGRLGRTMGRASGSVTARLATQEEGSLLDVDLPAALLVERRLVADTTDRTIEATETAYAGSRWAIDTGAFVLTDALAPAQPERADTIGHPDAPHS